jgi:hypothetical protein
LIEYNFNLFNTEIINSNISVKRFEYLLYSTFFTEDLENVITTCNFNEEINTEEDMLDENCNDKIVDNNSDNQNNDEIDDNIEEENALDVDEELDVESIIE